MCPRPDSSHPASPALGSQGNAQDAVKIWVMGPLQPQAQSRAFLCREGKMPPGGGGGNRCSSGTTCVSSVLGSPSAQPGGLSWPHSQDQPGALLDQRAPPPNQQATSGPGVSPSPSLTASGAPRALASRDPMSGVSTPSRKTASQRLGPLSPVLIRYRVFLLCLKTYFWFLLWRFQTVALAN